MLGLPKNKSLVLGPASRHEFFPRLPRLAQTDILGYIGNKEEASVRTAQSDLLRFRAGSRSSLLLAMLAEDWDTLCLRPKAKPLAIARKARLFGDHALSFEVEDDQYESSSCCPLRL